MRTIQDSLSVKGLRPVSTQRILALALSLTSFAVGCGGTANREVPAPQAVAPAPGPVQAPISDPNVIQQPSPNSDLHQDSNTAFVPAQTYDFEIAGAGTEGSVPTTYTTPSFNTDNLLRVRIQAGTANNLSLPSNVNGGYSNGSGQYTCISYTLEVLGQSVMTIPLSADPRGCDSRIFNDPSNPMGTRQAQNSRYLDNSQTLDFSRRLGSGHGSVSIRVTGARTDYKCQLFLAGYFFYAGNPVTYGMVCPMTAVYKTHVVGGRLEIQTNGTSINGR
jgi:hypothetical protein